MIHGCLNHFSDIITKNNNKNHHHLAEFFPTNNKLHSDMPISCYIIIQIVSEKIYFLKGSLFKAGEAKISRASCILLRAHACPERHAGTELLSTWSSRLCPPQPRVVFSDRRFPIQIQLPSHEEQRIWPKAQFGGPCP